VELVEENPYEAIFFEASQTSFGKLEISER
jgi:hypothetical protein